MKKLSVAWLSSVAVLAPLMAACAPKPVPPLPATVPASQPTLVVPSSTIATTEDAAWQKVISDAKKEGAVTAYSFGFIGDLGNAVRVAFKDKYGIDLEFVTGTGSQLLPRIQAESRAGMHVADVLEGANTNAIFAKNQGLTAPYGDLPELRNKDIWVVDPRFDKEGQILGRTFTIHPPWINTKLLNPTDAPKSWKAILDPKWKGKIVVTDPDTMPIPGELWVLLHSLGFSDDYFQQMGNQALVIAPDQRENDAMVARAQSTMTITSSESTMAPLIANGAPVAPIDMAEGVATVLNPTVVLLTKAPHPNAARLFSNWLMSKEGQDVLGKFGSVGPLRNDVPDYRPPQMRVKYSKLVPMGQQDEEEAAQVQTDKVLSKMWRKK